MRQSDLYWRHARRREAYLQRILFPILAAEPGQVRYDEPYWGGLAASFWWGNASLPRDETERFGAGELRPLGELLIEGEDSILGLARRSLAEAVDVLAAAAWEAAAEDGDDGDITAVVDFTAAAAAYALADPEPLWLEEVADDRAFVDLLVAEVDPPTAPVRESFGWRRVGLWLVEGASRLRSAPARGTSAAVLKVARPAVHRSAATFLGDVLTYLRQRERDGANGAIAATVAQALAQAEAHRSAADPATVVIAHSMGGNIVYDLLSHLRPDLHCDTLVTVGSQPGLFAELGLFPAVRPPVDPAVDRVPALPNLDRWINVFDTNDTLGFAAEGIFAGVEDFQYDTGKGMFTAHSAYFGRVSFYVRLTTRLRETP